jgi:hypothetical protein
MPFEKFHQLVLWTTPNVWFDFFYSSSNKWKVMPS